MTVRREDSASSETIARDNVSCGWATIKSPIPNPKSHLDMGAIADRIRGEVGSWPDVTVLPHRFGGVEFRVGRRELGHIHGDRLADLPFPVRIREELVAAGRAEPHHVMPDSGWISFRIRAAEDAGKAIELFRLNYERPWLDDGGGREASVGPGFKSSR